MTGIKKSADFRFLFQLLNSFIRPVTLCITLLVNSCSLRIDKEIDIEAAEELIRKSKLCNCIDSALLKKTKAEQIIRSGDAYLFVMNSLNGDFNGWVYSKDGSSFDGSNSSYFIRSQDSTKGNWTQVYGKY